MRSALYTGTVMHARTTPKENVFRYRVCFYLLDLDELPELDRRVRLFGWNRRHVVSLHDRDHLDVRAFLVERGIEADRVLLLTNLRVLGYVFNPVSFWFCHDRAGRQTAILAEVSNTFGGRHSYLLHNRDGSPLRDGQELAADKVFHVSPFNGIEGEYRFRFHLQRSCPVIRIDYGDAEGELLLTSIAGKLRTWSTATLLGAFLRMPFLTAGVIFRIHWQALKLWLKGVPFRGAHPTPLQESTK